MTTTLLPAQRATLRNLHRTHKGDTMITFAYPAPTIQEQLDAALLAALLDIVQMMEAGYKGFAVNGPQHLAARAAIAKATTQEATR
jgi:hypothetical protein